MSASNLVVGGVGFLLGAAVTRLVGNMVDDAYSVGKGYVTSKAAAGFDRASSAFKRRYQRHSKNEPHELLQAIQEEEFDTEKSEEEELEELRETLQSATRSFRRSPVDSENIDW